MNCTDEHECCGVDVVACSSGTNCQGGPDGAFVISLEESLAFISFVQECKHELCFEGSAFYTAPASELIVFVNRSTGISEGSTGSNCTSNIVSINSVCVGSPLNFSTPHDVFDDDTVDFSSSQIGLSSPVDTDGPAVPGGEILSGAKGGGSAVGSEVGEVSTPKTN